MKTNFKRIGKQSISIVLAVMMMLSTMLVGMVTSNAAISNWVLRGSFNEWNEIQFGGADGGSITYDLSAYKGQTVEFRTDAYENGTLIMNSYGDTVVAGTEYQLTWKKGEPMKYTVSSTGTGKVTFTVISKNGNNYLTVTEGDQPITVTPYYVAGENSLVNGKEWTPEQAEDKMSYDETTKIYSITYDKKAAGTYKFKIIEGSSTWRGHNDFNTVTCTDENCTVSDVDGNNHNIQITTKVESNITITLDSTGKKLTISAEPTTQKYTVAVDKNIANGTVTTSATSLAAGKTFTVTATPDNGYVLNAITVTDADGKSVAATDESTHTYTMPASNVTVSATFKVKTDVKYSVTYTAPTGEGVVSASIAPTDTTLAEGTPVTVTVTVKEGYTASLAVDGVDVKTSTSGNAYTFTFSMPAKAITVAPKVTKAEENKGTEINDLYLIYTTENEVTPTKFTQYLNLYYDSNNQVYAYLNEDTKFDKSKTYKFMISTLKGENSYKGTTYYNKDNYSVNVTTTDGNNIAVGNNSYGYGDNDGYHQYFYGFFSVKAESQDTVSSVKINLGYYKDGKIQESAEDTAYAYSYEVIPISGVEGMPQVFAKDGTIRATYQKYADMADTVLTAENTADLTKYNNENKYYETAYAKVGTKLKITTTIGEDYREKYFVKAFSINGYSYGIINASQAKKQNGVYTCEYTIPEDFEGSRIEITPIYYYIDDKDTVTFYVEGFDETVQAKWGNTVAVQAWYANCEKEDDESNSKFDSPTKNALGGYPGQPLVYEGGKYSMQIPKYLNGEKANYVKGITLNNYFWDDIHKKSFKDQGDKSESNCQTYDYDDFYKLSESPDVDNIIFDFRYRTTTDNDPKNNLASSTYNESELEPLKDYSGNIVDIFGNFLSEKWTPDYDNKYLTVISDGYKKNYIGKYATEWSVYDHDGNRIAQINCSNLIDENKVDKTYTTAYNALKPYANLPVKIAYEKSNYYSSDDIEHKGTRADGRWYFSKKAQKISANVKIEYRADDTSKFVEDTFVADSNVGVNTKAQAYFTNADSNGKTTCQGTVDGGNFSVHAQTDDNANYYFIGWYLKTSDGYSFITNESDADFPMTNNETYVARFITTPSGTLTLSHTLLNGSADGKTYIKADIIDSNGNVKASIAETSGNLVIPAKYVTYTSTYSILLTLRTVPYGNDTVEGFYEGFSSNEPVRYPETFTGTGEKTYTVTREIKSLFEESTDNEGNTSYNLKKSNIPFYSNIKSNPINYQITYVYFTRLDDQQIYVIKDTVSGMELEEMWAANEAAGLNKEQLSKAFITKKAPFVSNYREEITWDMDRAIINLDYTATVFSNTKTDKLNISALTVAGSWTQPATVDYGTLAKSDGDYLYKIGTDEFPAKFKYSGATDYEFSFWAIFDNFDAAQKYSDAVAAYMLTPDANMSKRLTDLTKLDGYDKLIAKSYSKEYNYISYQDYYIVPVYANRFAQDEIKESQASIRLLEYTRNQWTNENGVKGDGTLNEGGTKTDYLYTDFALSFDKNQELIKNNAKIKVGIAFEVVAKYADVENLEKYVTDSNTKAIESAVKTATKNGNLGTYTYEDANGVSSIRDIYRYEIANSDISVKNRIEYYLRFKNSETSQQNVMKVYSYIYDTESGEIYLSDPVYMNMYDIGNLTYITSDLASIDLQPASEL